jgi:DNA-binding GntR family transcriptional regulator
LALAAMMGDVTTPAVSIQHDDAPANKHELAYRLIRERIEGAVYQPGQRLVIDALARDLNMSQVPIREAIRRLQAEGWITYRHNSGPEVANIGLEQWQARLEVLAILEGYATALAAPAVSAEDIASLRDSARAMQRAMEQVDPIGFAASNRQFHRVMYARCPNPVLVDRITETQAQLDAMRGRRPPSVPQRGPESMAEHLELIELLESGSTFDTIEAHARTHKRTCVEVAGS